MSNGSAVSRRALAPLFVITVSFFLPTYRTCGSGTQLENARVAAEEWLLREATLIVLPYLGAASMLALTLYALAQATPSRSVRRLGLGVVAATVLVNAAVCATLVLPLYEMKVVYGAALIPAVALVTAAIRSGRSSPPWRIWAHLLCAFGLAVIASFTYFFLAIMVAAGEDRVEYGAGLFVGAPLVLVLMTLPSFASRRPA